MTDVVLFLTLPPDQRQRYVDGISSAFPDIRLHLATSHDELRACIGSAEVLLAFGLTLTDDILKAATRLRWIQAMGSGVDGIIGQPSLSPAVAVTNMHGFHGIPVAEAAIMAMLALARGFKRIAGNQAQAKWERFPARTLNASTVCIYGVGAIAATLAPLCRAFGARVTGISGTPRQVAGFDHVYPASERAAALAEADFLVLLMPLTAATRGMVNADVLAGMKAGSYLVNVARGGVLDEDALQQSLASGQLAGAALDVFQTEPLPPEHPLWRLPNVIVMPHLAGFFDRYPDHALPVITHNLRCFLQGDMPAMMNKVHTP